MNGQSALENHVSSTSGSCWMSSLRQRVQRVGSGASSSGTTISSQSRQYHTGMEWPHQIWRDTGQSRMFSIQLKKTFSW